MGSGASSFSTPFLCVLSLTGAGLRLPWYPLPGGTLLVRCRLAVPGHVPHFTSTLGCPRDGPFLPGITRRSAPCIALGSPRPPCGLCTSAVVSAALEARLRLRLQIAPSRVVPTRLPRTALPAGLAAPFRAPPYFVGRASWGQSPVGLEGFLYRVGSGAAVAEPAAIPAAVACSGRERRQLPCCPTCA